VSARWRKVLGDLKERPTRVLAVTAAIAVGTTMLTAALGAREILEREVDASFKGSNPAGATLLLDEADRALAVAAKDRPGVTDAEPRRVVRARAEVARGEWRPLRIFAVEDFAALRLARFQPERGAWPPADGTLLIERSALSLLRTEVGASLRVRAPGGEVVALPVAGVVHDPAQAPGWMDQLGYAYTTPATLARLGQGDHLDELLVAMPPDTTRAARTETAAALATWLEGQGRTVRRVETSRMRHPHADHMGTMLLLLQLFSAVALVLSGALAANVVAATMARQVRQIGVLKAIGGTTRQIAAIYLAGVAVPAIAAVLVGLPLGVVAAGTFAGFAAEHLNLMIASSSVSWGALSLAAGLGLVVPLVAALVPVLRAARTPARVALADLGAGAERRGSSRIGAWLEPTSRLALRNALRRPVRTFLTVGALALGGALLLTAGNVYTSLQGALGSATAARGEDISVRLLQPAPADELARQVEAVPGVRAVESWGSARIALALPGGGGTSRYTLLAPPADTASMSPRIVAGRWPAQDEIAVVVNRTLQDTEEGLEVGGEVTLLVERRRVSVPIVGVIEEVAEPALYTGAAGFTAITGLVGAAADLRVFTADNDSHSVASRLEEALLAGGWFPLDIMTHDSYGEALSDHFLIILISLTVIASAAIVVGGLGLATSMSLGVLERTREIGVLRALGATQRVVLRVVLIEGLALAGLSTLLALVLAVPLSLAVCRAVGNFGLHAAVPLVLSPATVAVWLNLAVIVATAACVGPARTALRPAVRDVLAHE
jgi:putative ABC transport system permease protein